MISGKAAVVAWVLVQAKIIDCRHLYKLSFLTTGLEARRGEVRVIRPVRSGTCSSRFAIMRARGSKWI